MFVTQNIHVILVWNEIGRSATFGREIGVPDTKKVFSRRKKSILVAKIVISSIIDHCKMFYLPVYVIVKQYCPLFCSFLVIVRGWVSEWMNRDQDSLLVKRRNDNHSPGPVIRELVPSCHQRSELSNTILCIFSRWDQRIGEGIPISDSLREEATFINICISNGSLKCQRELISTKPSFGDKVICWYTGFKTFIQQYKSIVFPPFLEGFPF